MIFSLSQRIRKHSLFKNVLAIMIGSSIFLVASLGKNFVLARNLEPAIFGAWSLGLVFIQYAQWSHLTYLNAFRLDGARNHGRGDHDKVNKLRQLTWTACMAGALIVSVSTLLISPFLKDPGIRWAALMMACMLVPFQLYNYIRVDLGIREKFVGSSRMHSTFAILNAVLTLVLVIQFGFWGAVFAQAFSYLLILLIFRKWYSLFEVPSVDRKLAKEQLSIGLPIGLNGLVTTLFTTVDRTMVAGMLGLQALGMYGLTGFAQSSLSLMPLAVSEVIYVRVSRQFGATKSEHSLVTIVMPINRLLALFGAMVAGLVFVWTPFLVKAFLPAYMEGILALQIYVLGIIFMFPIQPGSILLAIGRATDLLMIYCAATILEVILLPVGIKALGINGAALANTTSNFVVFLAVNIVGLRRAKVNIVAVFVHLLECIAPVLAVTLVIGSWQILQRGIFVSMPSLISEAFLTILIGGVLLLTANKELLHLIRISKSL